MASVANDHEAPTSADLSFSGREDPSENSSSMAVDGGKSGPPRADQKGTVFKLDSSRGEGRVLENRGAVEASWMNEFMEGDMVWGKVKSYPWWPGYIYNEAFASPSVRELKKERHVLVAFFGDKTYGWFEPVKLIPFEPHFAEKSRQTTLGTFVKAVKEAVEEVSRRGALSMACCCRNNFRPTAISGYFTVDLPGFEPEVKYSSWQIEKARDYYVPAETLSFLQNLALSSQANKYGKSIARVQNISLLLAFRRAKFQDFDPTYPEAFGVNPIRPSKDQLDRINATRGLLVAVEGILGLQIRCIVNNIRSK